MAHPAVPNERFTASPLDDTGVPLSPLGSNPFTLHRRSNSGLEQRRAVESTLDQPYRDFQLQNVRSSLYAGDLHDTMLLGEQIRARRARGDVAALVDFLNNQPPPPDNFMSIPYDDDDEDGRGRWSKIKKMGKRSKSMPKQQHIRLPDSAVAGVTTGGHRHIAISIPLEATPDGQEMRSQYPVFVKGRRNFTPNKDQVRTFRNEKGVVTVLRPVTEVYEIESGSAASHRRAPYINSQGHRPPPLPPHKPTKSLAGQNPEYNASHSRGFDTPLLDDSSAAWRNSRAPSRGHGSLRLQDSSAFHRSAYPARASSMVSKRSAEQPLSIDGLISPQDYTATTTEEPRPNCAARQRNHLTGNDNSPRPKAGRFYERDIIAAFNRNSDLIGNRDLFPDGPPLSQEDESRPTTAGSTRSRRDIVREKKRRDMEAAKKTAKAKTQQKRASHQVTQQTLTSPRMPRSAARKAEEQPSTTQPAQLTLSSLMVVVDVEPSSAGDKDLPVRPKAASPPPEKPSKGSPTAVPVNTVSHNGIPTPPISTSGSPPQTHAASDRTSLTRRREWKVIREQERKARDAMAMARVKAQQLASGGVTYEKGAIAQPDREVMRLYEAYREHRLRDMERRLRRLERNGDIWLQALVPVLDNMNRTMEAANEQPLDDLRDWASDGETSVTAEKSGRKAEKRRLNRRASLSQGRLLEKMTGHSYEEDAWSDSLSRSDDTSGFGTIEPLMRELAGEARRLRGTTQSPVVTNRGHFHAI